MFKYLYIQKTIPVAIKGLRILVKPANLCYYEQYDVSYQELSYKKSMTSKNSNP